MGTGVPEKTGNLGVCGSDLVGRLVRSYRMFTSRLALRLQRPCAKFLFVDGKWFPWLIQEMRQVRFFDCPRGIVDSIYDISILATHSTCPVCGNISTGCTSRTLYPSSAKYFASRARVAGLQDT